MVDKIRICVLIMIFLVGTVLYAADGSEIIKKTQRKYETTKTMSARFTQHFHWKLAGEQQQQDGNIWLKGDDKFKIETPDQIIVSDGKTLWTYSRVNNQVIIDRLEKSSQNLLPHDILLKYVNDYRPVQVTEEKINGVDCYIVRLVPKNEHTFIRAMRVWIDKKEYITHKIEHVDVNENTTTYELYQIALDQSIPDKLFTFTKMNGVEVVDLR